MEPKKNPKIDVNEPGYTRMFFQVGLTLALLLTVGLFSFKKYEKKRKEIKIVHDIPDIEMVDPTTQEKPKELPPPPPELKVIDDDEPPPPDQPKFKPPEFDPNLLIKPPAPVKKKKPKEAKIFEIVEEQPEFPGGFAKMQKYLQQTIKYPREAEDEGAEGTVYISVVVEADGRITHVRPLVPEDQQIGYGLEEEAIRVVKKMPRWTPGKQATQNVRVRMTIPITFTLEEDY